MNQEYEVMIRVVVNVEDMDGPVPIENVRKFVNETIRVNFDTDHTGNAPEGSGEDATTSMGADIISLKTV